MDNPEHRARQLVAELELISHAPAINLEPSAKTSEEKGGKCPPGGVVGKDDAEPGFRLKSHLHFKRRLDRCHTNAGFECIARDAETALRAWKHPPAPPKDSIPWREAIAKDTRKARFVAADWNVTKDYVWMLRRTYRDAA